MSGAGDARARPALYLIEPEGISCSLRELLKANEDLDDETIAAIRALAVGESLDLDEGAGGTWSLRRTD